MFFLLPFLSSLIPSLQYCTCSVFVIAEPIPAMQVKQALASTRCGQVPSPVGCRKAGTQAATAT